MHFYENNKNHIQYSNLINYDKYCINKCHSTIVKITCKGPLINNINWLEWEYTLNDIYTVLIAHAIIGEAYKFINQ